MRRLLICLSLLNLGACSLIMPSPDPNQAWVALAYQDDQTLKANRVDEKPLEDDRYFQVMPGRHELEVRLKFPVGGQDIGPDHQGYLRTCLLKLSYGDFAAGERYQLEAGAIGFRPWARLYDEQHNEVARARESRCGDV
ncbi:PA0061/PA0062 family lipoprotein [Metapseudomonas boanensis]|uniref:Lipoprotein n=1 Tax=Metapseudomonas boanensis TaxID=2822138 RepID=A0ABS5XI91_9GAMM|nr:hypothetical protein [Pseudomonas boanensis]MBT8767370.1 hypothetical protein [Pseudomonas boanensis]